MAYNPADFELVEAPAGSAPPYNPADFELVAEPEGSGFLRQSLDIPVSALGGVVTGLKGMTDLFGANNPVSQELASYQQFYNQSLSPEGQADQQEVARIMQEAQDKGMWEQIKAGGRAFAVAPLDTAAQSLGTMAPIVATGLAGRAVGLGAKGVQAVQAGAGAGMNTGIVKDSIYQDTKNFLLQAGKSEEEADRVALEAQSYGGQNIDQLLLAAGLGAADAVFGAEKILGNAISKSGGRVTGGVVAGALKTGVSEAIPEAAQGGQEAMAPNIALQREGYNVPTMRGVFAQGTMEGLAGFAAGAPVGAAEGMEPRMDDRNLPPIQVDQQPAFTPPPAANTVEVQETFGEPTTAAAEPAQEQAATTSYNPDDFEVVEEPSAPIVTEPPAAPRFQFDLADDTATAPDMDAEADVFAGVPQQQPSGPQSGIDVSKETDGGSTPPGSMAQEQPTGGVEYFKQLGAQDAADPSRKRKRAVPQNFKLAYTVGWSQAKDAARQQGPAEVKTPSAATEKVATEMAAATVDQSKPVPSIVRDGVITQLQGALAEVQESGDKGRQRVSVSIPGDGNFQIIKTEESIKKAITGLSKLSAPVSTALPRVTLTESNREIDNYAGVLEEALGIEGAIQDQQTLLKQAGENTSIGKAAAKTIEALQRRAEVRAENAPSQRSRRRIKNMTAQSGAIDLSIVEDLVEYGKTIYRAGMTYAQWSAAMIKEFGQAVAEFLQQAFNRIVQAYKDSPYSDTTGAVGDVRPKSKPRQFEEKAKKSDAITEETKAELGSEYVPITLKGTAEEAKAWMAQNGVDAAERRILELNSEEITPTPLDFGIGLELAANLSATGQHSRAAAVVRTMSRRATSIGQTISVLAMLARLTPDGIVFYANQLIEQYINEMPEGIKARVRTAQTQVAEIEKGVAEDRYNVSNTTIINGEHGGEKIATKIRRRISDKRKSQGALTSVRSVLMSKATKAEAIKQIADILQGAGISQSEAQSLANTIATRFYKVIEEARKGRAAALKPKSGKARISFDKLMSKLTEGKVSDEDFVSTLAVIAGVPAMTPEMRKQWQELARQYQEATDPDVKMVLAGRIFEEAHSILPADFWAKLRAISYLSMLFAPKTWIRNLGGNQIQFIANVGKDTVIDAAVDPLVSVFTGKRSTSGVYVGKRFGALLTPIWDVKKGYDWNKKQNPQASFSENMKAGIEHLRVLSKLTTQNKFDITDVKEVGRRMFSSKFMRAWDTGLSIALGGGDRGFWMAQFRTSMAQQEAAAKRNGEWTGQPTPEMVETAFAEAAYAIYQNPNFISKGLNWIRKGLNWIFSAGRTTQFGVGTSLMAFTQVPGSIFMRAFVEWSPLGTINALYQSMSGILYAKSGGRYGVKFDQRKFNNAFTQAILGTGVYAAGYWLYAMGIITASREDDDDLEAMRKTLGGGGYRINVSALKRMLLSGNFFDRQETEEPDFIMTYDWAQPMAIAVAAGAEYAAQSERASREGLRKKLLGTSGTLAISLKAGAKSLEEQPLLSGLSSFIKTWGYSGPLEAVYGTIANIPGMFVPQLVRQASQLQDNMVRETRGDRGMVQAFTRIASQTPFVQDVAPPRFDILGQAVERYQYGGNTLFNVLANPGMVSRAKEVPALSEVARLMNVTGETSQIPRMVSRTADINGQSVELTNEQISAYQYYLGNYTMSMFNWRMASPRYARLPDTEKVRLLAQDLEDVNAATKSALFGHDVNRLTRRQRIMRNNLVNSPLGQSMPPR